MMSEQEINRIANDPILFWRWLLDSIEAGDFSMADVKKAWIATAKEGEEEFDAVAATAWAEWSEGGER